VLTDDAEDFGPFFASPGRRRISQQSREERWSFLDALRHCIFTRLGEGTVNINAVIHALKSRNYDGWLLIEQDTTNVHPASTARKNWLYLENVLKIESE
jgi:inosose dehydratase